MKIAIVEESSLYRHAFMKWFAESPEVSQANAYKFSHLVDTRFLKEFVQGAPDVFVLFIASAVADEMRIIKMIVHNFPLSKILIVATENHLWRVPLTTLANVSVFTDLQSVSERFYDILKSLIDRPAIESFMIEEVRPLGVRATGHLYGSLRGTYSVLEEMEKDLLHEFCRQLPAYLNDPSAGLIEGNDKTWDQILTKFAIASRVSLAFIFLTIDRTFILERV